MQKKPWLRYTCPGCGQEKIFSKIIFLVTDKRHDKLCKKCYKIRNSLQESNFDSYCSTGYFAKFTDLTQAAIQARCRKKQMPSVQNKSNSRYYIHKSNIQKLKSAD